MQPKRDMKGSRRERWMWAAAFYCLLTMLAAWLLRVSPAINPSGVRLAPSVSTASAQTDEPPAISNATAKMSDSAPMELSIAETESITTDLPQTLSDENLRAETAFTAQQQSSGRHYIIQIAEIVAQTGVPLPGVGTVSSLGKGPSINNQGNVVFTAVDNAGQHAVFTEIDGTLDTRTVQSTIFSFDEYVQINDARNNTQRRIIWREQSNDGLLNKINRLGTFGDDFQIVARNRFLPLINSPFDLTRPWATINNNGRVVFSAVTVFGQATFLCTQKVIEGSGFETIDDYYCADQGLSNYPDLYPMVSDNDRVVVRGGHDETAPLVVFTNPTMKQSEAIFVGQPIGFDTIGSKPGISDDGRFVAFMGAGPSIGAGIFGIDLDANAPTFFQIAGPPLSQSFSSVGRTSRVGVNRQDRDDSNEYYVTFLAARATGGPPESDPFGIYVSRFELNDLGQPAPNPVNIVTDLLIETGEEIPGLSSLGTILDIAVYDPINTSGLIVFWVQTENTQAIIRVCLDRDGDALCDDWEINGIRDADGNVTLPLHEMGADPNIKDIFIEVDFMGAALDGHNHKPSLKAMNDVIKSFFNAPVDCDSDNPEACQGIRLHIDYGPETIMAPQSIDPVTGEVSGESWGTRSESEIIPHDINFGELIPSDSDTPICNSDTLKWTAARNAGIRDSNTPPEIQNALDTIPIRFSGSRRQAFHYVQFVHNRCDGPSFGFSVGDQPISIISAGAWPSCESHGREYGCNQEGTPKKQAVTFMHELGHTLGLSHGGNNKDNYKPNYLSVMNYTFSILEGLLINIEHPLFDPDKTELQQILDYSKFDVAQIRMLNESDGLDELVGLDDGIASGRGYGTEYACEPGVRQKVLDILLPIDWNCDGTSVDQMISANVNASPLGIPVPNVINQRLDLATNLINQRRLQLGNITMAFSQVVPDGFVISQLPESMISGFTNLVRTIVKPATKVNLVVSSGPKTADPDDEDDDGVFNEFDNCPAWFNPVEQSTMVQLDDDNDGLGDACDMCPKGRIEDADPVLKENEDRDDDGIGDACDVCPAVYNPLQKSDACKLSMLTSYNDWANLQFDQGLIGDADTISPSFDLTAPIPVELTAQEEALITKFFDIDIINPKAQRVHLGSKTTYEFRVKNIGALSDTYHFLVNSSEGWANTLDLPTQVTLEPDEEVLLLIDVSVPSTASIDQADHLTVAVESINDHLLEQSASVTTTVATRGDLDGDGDVDGFDLSEFTNAFANSHSSADLNGDGNYDNADVELFAENFGSGSF